MHKNRRKRNIVILSLIGIICLMAAGYAAFQTQLEVTGTSNIASNWDIEIIAVSDAEIKGNAEEASSPVWDALSASLEANLYGSNDSVEYDITISNKGNLDAILSDILTNTESSNDEAVIITFSGYAQNEILEAGKEITVHVTIAYNPNYTGGETSSEVKVDFEFTQNDSETNPSEQNHLITFDCTTNGGSSCTNLNMYVIEGTNVTLPETAGTKANANFVGWSTSSDGISGTISTITMGTNDITLYAIYEDKDTTPPIIDSISTTSTTNSITVVVAAHDDESEITKYEFSIDNGKTWINNGNNNTYTFTGLTENTSYEILVRVTNELELSTEGSTSDFVDITTDTVTEGDGLYKDEDEEDRYVYKGATVNNYIWFNEEMWRIIAIESDGTLKIVRNDVLDDTRAFDSKGYRSGGYCSQGYASTYGCNAWAATSNMVGEITSFVNGNYEGEVTADSELNTYLNGEYYNDYLSEEAKSYIIEYTYNIGAVAYSGSVSSTSYTIANQLEDEDDYKWIGKVALINMSDYIRSNSSTSNYCDRAYGNYMYTTCINTTWMYISGTNWWTITPHGSYTNNVWDVNTSFGIITNNAIYSYGVRPVVHLVSGLKLSGSGTYEDPYKINEGAKTSTLDTPTFTETEASCGSETVTITFPEGCGTTYTCTYQKDNGSTVNVTSTSVNVSFTDNGSVVAAVSDGTNRVSSSYTAEVEKEASISEIITAVAVETGDGLYKDSYETDRYVYRGSDVDNYITFDGETWRIIAIESNGTLKIVKNDNIGSMQFDPAGNRNTEYCSKGSAPTYGCNAWASTSSMVGGITSFENGSYSGAVEDDSYLNDYLNNTYYYNTLSSDAQSLIVDYPYNIGGVSYTSSLDYTVAEMLEDEDDFQWEGKVALINLSDYIRSNSNDGDNCNTLYGNYSSTYYYTCRTTTWMYTSLSNTSSSYWWTITPCGSGRYGVWRVNYSNGNVNISDAYASSGARPVVHLTSDLKLCGSGTSEDPYTIVS